VVRRAASLLFVICATCSFNPGTLNGGGSDGGGGADTGNPPVDSRPPADVTVADQAPADAAPDLCPTSSLPVQLGTIVSGSLAGGPSAFAPTCAPGSAAEAFYHVDISGETGTNDFTVELRDAPFLGINLDPAIDVNTTCAPGVGETCANVAGVDQAEIAVVPNVGNGRQYVVVDSAGGTGAYQFVARIRQVRTAGMACDGNLVNSRCDVGSVCLQSGAVNNFTCRSTTGISAGDPENNATACTANPTFSDDGVFLGIMNPTVNNVVDIDVVAITTSADVMVNATIYTSNGGRIAGCDIDLMLEALQSNNCTNADNTVIATDDDSGLGSCPKLQFMARKSSGNFVRVTAKVAPAVATPYILVIDYLQ
jgi:hypothetical protein